MSHHRPLTDTERAALPAPFNAALPGGVVLINAHHPLSHLSRLFRGYAVILVRGRRIYWPGLPADLSGDKVGLTILAHELVHILQYDQGMTLWLYIWRDIILRQGRYTYRLAPGKPFAAYGYEQQAAMMEDWMRLHYGLGLRFGASDTTRAAIEATVPYLHTERAA